MKHEELNNALKKCFEDKGKRKFTQSVEFIMNFGGVDFSKQDKKLNLSIVLPNGTGKTMKVAVFADGNMALDAKKAGVDLVMSVDEMADLSKDRPRLKKLMVDHVFFAQPSLMMQVGKNLGQIMGTREKLPKPIVGGTIEKLAEEAKRTIKIKTKGKYLPVLACIVGTENMEEEKISENIIEVYETVLNTVGKHFVKSAY
ncbi:MAG: 50S ribosomal protein L1, partial [Candidatus Micrarchaeota archaeon]